MTASQRLWFNINIFKDKSEVAEYIKNLCMHIRPEAYFKEKPAAVSTDIFKDITEKLGRELTPEEVAGLQEQGLSKEIQQEIPSEDLPVYNNGEEILDEDIDMIERV